MEMTEKNKQVVLTELSLFVCESSFAGNDRFDEADIYHVGILIHFLHDGV